MPRDPFVELEAARANVLEEAELFVEELEPVLDRSLHAGFEGLRLAQAGHVGRLDEPTLVALEEAAGRAIELGVAETVERLRSPEIWLSPITAPELPTRTDPAHPIGMPEWVARLGGSARKSSALGRLDEMTNRIWVAISAAAKPLDPVLEEFGFRPERRRLGGGSFGVSPRTLPQLDPSGAIGRRWKSYRAAYERMTALAAFEA
jgi:poly-gamma-glutamate capsule biosynthesis protein CapA/YwtB (metallophosphatase superfamily)